MAWTPIIIRGGHSLHVCVLNLSSDCQFVLQSAGTTEDNTSTSGCSPARSYEGKALCKENGDCCDAIIVTVWNNTEVINQLLPAVHSWTLIEGRGNGTIQQSQLVFFSLLPIVACDTFLCSPLVGVEVCLGFFCTPFCTSSSTALPPS